MPNIIFYLNTGAINKDAKVPVMAKIIHKGKRYYKTIDSVKESDWNPGKRRLNKNHKNAPDNRHKEINATLNQLEKLMKGYNDYCLLNEHPVTEQAIKQILKGVDPVSGKKSPNRPEIKFDEAFKEWLDFTQKNNEYNTYRARNTTYNFFNKFQEEKNIRITFKNLDMQLFDSLRQFAFDREEPLANNTFARRIKNLKMFLNWCEARGYYSGKLPKEFRSPERDITPVTLTIEEFKTLYNHNFENEKLRKVRDIFCLGCTTGLRYSDLQRLRWEHLQGDNIVITTKKVKKPVTIPLTDWSRKIISRYEERPVFILPTISNQKFNTYIKEAAKKAKIKSKVIIDSYRGNQFSQEPKKKHEVLTAHVARKTFITISLFLGMKTQTVMEITGIKEERTLRKYIEVADQMKKTEMDNTWGSL
ncbi:tyrosine-type recombinase/integrase [Maribellus comscasis]|uniref:Tyrosine-type recombinase/integrase n=1 Tax=Maribellus comscasis TaxID=2681766 RepID=A0A6I6JMM0_9BACT|nr:site-specific integrase [Maribellus comscasis]QGY44176.1 tyrosine-type recombinase/integrase [Maribellus comscasis]